jgi:hypothetical protein
MIKRNIVTIVKDMYIICKENNNALNSNKEEILYQLEKIMESITYAAPEQIKSKFFFQRLQFILNSYISIDDYDKIPWCKQVIDIFLDPTYKI